MQMRITKYGEPILKQKAEEVDVFDAELEKLANDMFESMCEANGIGLAAPQVGVSKRMFVIDMRRRYDTDAPCNFTLDGKPIPLELAMPLVAVNPEVENAGEYVKSGGLLIASGIIDQREKEVDDAMKTHGFEKTGAEYEKGWCACTYRKI